MRNNGTGTRTHPRFLCTYRSPVLLGQMSATLDAKLFTSFFNGAPLVSVPGRTFPVATYYLEDLLDATDHIIEEGSRYARRQRDDRETASMWVSTRGGEKRRETVSLDSELVDGVSDEFAGYKMSTRR